MKIRARDIVFAILSLAALIAGGMVLISNLSQTEGTPALMVWYLSLSTVAFIILALLALLETLCRDKLAGLKKALYGADMAIGTVYTLLVVIDASPLIAEFIAKELWRSAIGILTLSIYVI